VTKERVNLAYNIVKVIYDYNKGKPDRDELTIDLMRKIYDKMRWGKTGYIFVLDFHGNTIYHPNKKFMHENRWNLTRHGIKIVQLLTFSALKHPNGTYVKYWAYNPLGKPILKISYVKVFKPLHFFIGSGIYLDKLNKTLLKRQKEYRSLLEELVKQILSGTLFILMGVLAFTAAISYFVQKIFERYERELETEKNKLFDKAIHDSLTGLYNKEAFKVYLRENLELAKRENKNLAVVFIDLDRFKEVNDTYGHEHGDKLLKKVAKRLEKCVRKVDKIARFGGDEFVILLNDVKNKEYIVDIVQRILEEIKKPLKVDDKIHYLTTSIGISVAPMDSEDADELLKNADTAMYKAKQEGKDRFEFFTDEMSKLALKRLKIKEMLHDCIQNNEFIIHYQPQIDKNDKLFGSEALVRCKDPETGKILSPAEFIPIAIETGIIDKVDLLVIEKAIKQYKEWIQKGYTPGILSCNITIYQLEKTDFKSSLSEILKKYDFNPQNLNLEVTEESVMEHPDVSIDTLKKIKQLGVKINIDDFGTGYSSLSYLKKLPISKIKIDREFIKDIPEDKDDEMITKAIIDLAKILNLKVIAEGVETKIQRDFVFENGCDYVQGYYYSPPIPPQEFEEKFLK
jgi:diguanylate cyclase (GGDEF)-like protein